MKLKTYLFAIAIAFLIPAVVLAAMGNGLAWAFGIIAAMLAVGAIGSSEGADFDVSGKDFLEEDARYSYPGNFEYVGVPIVEDDRSSAID